MNPLYEGLGEEQVKWLKQYPLPHAFAVISWGHAATVWLAHTINSHPDIFCVHHAGFFWSSFGNVPQLDGLEYLRVIAAQGNSYIAAGDIHGVSRHTLPTIKAALGENFSCAALVREPISRLRSQLAMFENAYRLAAWNIDYLDDIIKQKLALPDQSYLTRLFVHGANMLNAILEEQEVAPVYRTEDLTTRPDSLCGFVKHITNGKVKVDSDWALAAIARGKINSHIEQQLQDGQPKQKQAFEHWQIDVIRKIVQPKAWEAYADLGYPIPDFL